MTELAEAVLGYLQSENAKGKKSFTELDLVAVGNISFETAERIVNELEYNGYIEIHNNIASTFSLI